MSESQSIYIHIPFCTKKCIYCDFYSEIDLEQIPEYIQCLFKEMDMRKTIGSKIIGVDTFDIDTIYFGGGTPSLIPAKDVESLLQGIEKRFSLVPGVEITLEVNPGTTGQGYFKDLRSAGVNRLSIGAQSFIPKKLSFLKRIHTVEQSLAAINHAQKAGFDDIGLDMIYGLPFEDEKSWLNDLQRAIEIGPSHLSCYMLTIEPGTPLEKQVRDKRIDPINSSILSRLFKLTAETLNHAGYEHYEISNFAKKPQNRSRHNSKYWDMTPYLGFGAAAHSYDSRSRFWNHRNIKTYIKDVQSGRMPVQELENLSQDQKMLEMVMLRLRTSEGLNLEAFEKCFGQSFESCFKIIIDQICSESLGTIDTKHFVLNLEGKARLNSIVEAFAEKIL